METRRKLGHLSNQKQAKMFSSYDNDTFVYDSDIEWVKGRVEKQEDVVNKNDMTTKANIQEFERTRNIIHVCETPANFDKFDKIDGNKDTPKGHNYHFLPPIDPNNSQLTVVTVRNEEMRAYPVKDKVKKRSPLLHMKSSSFDSSKRMSKNATTSLRENKKSPKQRSISDTRYPLNINHKTRQFEEENVDNCRKKHRYQHEFSSLSPVQGNESPENPVALKGNTEESVVNSDAEKPKTNRRWLRKLARYATYDEGNVYLARASKSTQDLLSQENVTHINEATQENTNLDYGESMDDEYHSQRKVSPGKLIRQSMSYGISKFRQLSIAGRSSSSRKVDINYCMIDNDATLHETSKRLVPIESSEMLPNVFDVQAAETDDMSILAGTSFRRSFSVPDYLDGSSICDEELDELYLPRRMAICPDLPVPAMSQLRTYLVLTRLKQYCIV